MHCLRTHSSRNRRLSNQRGFTLVELLVTMAITTIILGATMVAMTDAIKATESATMVTDLNNGLRTAMDLMVRDMLQAGQGLPSARAILVPNGSGSEPIQLPGPVGSSYDLDGPSFCPVRTDDATPDNLCEDVTAVVPGPGRGPEVVEGRPTDMVTMLMADSAFESIPLRAFASDGRSITVATTAQHPAGRDSLNDTPDVQGDNIRAGDLIMLTKGASSALVQVSSVAGQVINFALSDSLRLNQSAAADGTSGELRNMAPVDTLVAPAQVVNTLATRIWMISYYLDVTTDPRRPRLVRRVNNGDWQDFDNSLGTTVAFDIEDLQITYDLSDPAITPFPTNVRMDDDDLAGTGACAPNRCYPNQIRKINILLAARSRLPRRGTDQFFRNRLVTQVSLRSLAFVDRYQ